MRPQRSKARNIFDIDSQFREFQEEKKTLKKKVNKAPEVKLKSTKSPTQFEHKLEEGLFNEFTKKDWHEYWKYKALEHKVKYFVPSNNYAKEYAIISSCMNNFSVKELKLLMDFLWDCDHDLVVNKRTMSLTMLSKGWLNTVYQSAILWQEGDYKTKAQATKEANRVSRRNREWVGEEPTNKNTESSKGTSSVIRI